MSETAKARTTPGAKVFGDDGWNRRMRIARERAKLSVEDVAKALGISPSAVRNWEGGHKFPSRENLQEFAEITAVDMVWLVTSFSAAELKLAEKLVGQIRAVPFLQPDQLDVLTHTEPGSAQTWSDAPTVFASFPCSEAAFATEIWGHRNSPDYEPGDIVILDPAVQPLHGDWVLASVGPVHFVIFARYVLRDLEERSTGGEDPPTALLVPSRGPPIPFRASDDRVLGTKVEHRYPRRTVSTAHAIESQKRA